MYIYTFHTLVYRNNPAYCNRSEVHLWSAGSTWRQNPQRFKVGKQWELKNPRNPLSLSEQETINQTPDVIMPERLWNFKHYKIGDCLWGFVNSIENKMLLSSSTNFKILCFWPAMASDDRKIPWTTKIFKANLRRVALWKLKPQKW